MVSNFVPSKHFQVRKQQRGIRQNTINLIIEYGELVSMRGADGFIISNRSADELQKTKKIKGKLLDSAKNILIVISYDTLITIYHKRG